jgi:hypothetical protein
MGFNEQVQWNSVDPIQQLTQEYLQSAAHHEAGHEVVCIAQKIPIRELGLRIDSKGSGMAHTFCRYAGDPKNTEEDERERNESIVLLFAGMWAQVRVFDETDYVAIKKDISRIDALLDEMYEHESEEWVAAKDKLREESDRFVAANWPAIVALAKALWDRPWKPQEQLPSIDMGWSDDTKEKSMSATEAEAILKPFGLSPAILPDVAGSWIRPQGS